MGGHLDAAETLFTQDVGYKLEPGSLLILQMHYNLLATDGKPAGSDRSAARLRLTDGTPQTRELDTLHDAGLRKRLPQLSQLPPRYVVWGDGTSDEMCTGIMTISPANPDEAPDGCELTEV